MNLNTLNKRHDETDNEYIIRICSMKEDSELDATWPEVASILNVNLKNGEPPRDESTWRKKYKRIKEKNQNEDNDKREDYISLEKQRYKINDERVAYRRAVREDSRVEATLEILKNEIRKFNKEDYIEFDRDFDNDKEKSMYVMLSDIHYGMTFKNLAGEYNSDIAKKRLNKYANSIIEKAKESGAVDCYVSLMGDLISGMIHNVIRIENKENIVEQVIGVSECISKFILMLAGYFDSVHVNYVGGNHSRVDYNLEDSLRGDRLDALIPWYCKTKLDNVKNVTFYDDSYDPTVAVFEIYDKLYVATHGDMDKSFTEAANRLENIVGRRPDVFLMAHMHVAEMKFENVTFLRNGSVCGSGDEYTMKKRLFGPATQTCFTVSEDGVESVYVIRL